MSQLSKSFGHIPGYPTGHEFKTREELVNAGVHGQSRAGIHGDKIEGAYSICLSGGYDDDNDRGERITYVGSGGRDDDTKKQIADQSWDDLGNEPLRVSSRTKLPVRVTRGSGEPGFYAPSLGYRYDGLYVVDSATMKQGTAGFNMCFFELRRIREEGDRDLPTRRLLTTQGMKRMLRNAPRS
ncbi:SRA-YDG protein [Tylopilus felleus]